MRHEIADWLNRFGLILGFLSFWFAAPEFIGVTRLQKWEQAFGRGLLKLPFAAKAVMAVTFSGLAGLYYFRWIMSGRTNTITPVQLALLSIVAATAFFFEVIRTGIAAWVSTLANNNLVRERSLFVGAILFTVSFVIQFAATFQTSPSH